MPPLGPDSARFNEKTIVRVEEPRHHDPVSPLALWTTVLVPPMAALLAQSLAYAVANYVCALGWPAVLVHLPHAGMLLVGGAAWLMSVRFYRRFADAPSEDGGMRPRSRFLAELALFGGPLFLLLIVAMWASTAVLRTCQ